MKKLIAGNWKMFKSVAETKAFLGQLHEHRGELVHNDLAIFAQAPLLPIIAAEWAKHPHGPLHWFTWGPQSIYWEEKGAFTGELSPVLAKEIGCDYALAGHSERRQFFGETNESAAKRALAAHQHGLKAVFCVGEHLPERDAGKTFEVLRAQMKAFFAIAPKAPEHFSVAYEPVWAIGTGRTATSAQAQEAHAFLRGEMKAAWGEEAAKKVRLLYGGSVKPDNAKELLSQTDVDGVLVGGASLEPASFWRLPLPGESDSFRILKLRHYAIFRT